MTPEPNNPVRALNNRIAVVSGAQQGIGREIALALGQAGATIVANYLDDDTSIESLGAELKALNVAYHLVKADLSEINQIERLMQQAEAIGGVDILVNNAAIFPRTEFLSMDVTTWDQVMTVNLKAPFLCSQLAARSMVAHERGGSIINITSGAAFRGSPRAAHYVTSKAGLVGLTRATALELAPHRIRVNAIAPGLTDTAQPRFGMSEDEITQAANLVPLGRIAVPSDVASVARFLASDEAVHVTGQTWHVNGGQYLA